MKPSALSTTVSQVHPVVTHRSLSYPTAVAVALPSPQGCKRAISEVGEHQLEGEGNGQVNSLNCPHPRLG